MTTEEALKVVDEGIYQINLQIKISEIEKIINYYEKNEFPYACYEYVYYEEINKAKIKITHSQALQGLKKLKAMYGMLYADEIRQQKLNQIQNENLS